MRNPRTVLTLVAAGIIALAIEGATARAFVGDRCRGERDCNGGGPQVCLADYPTSTTGHCVAGRVLP
jgi:hypothetical protein